MTNNSYYDDISLVREMLLKLEIYRLENEMLFESFKLTQECLEEFEEIIKTNNQDSKVFVQAYNKLTSSYIAMENLFSAYDKECKTRSKGRNLVQSVSYSIFDKRSYVFKYKLFLNAEVLTPEYVTVVRRLMEEVKTIGFDLSYDERIVLLEIDAYIRNNY